MLIDEGPRLAGTVDANLVQKLYNRGLAYLEVPVNNDDYIYGNLFIFLKKVIIACHSFQSFLSPL